MAEILKDISRKFNEFLLFPNLTDDRSTPANVSLKTPIVKLKKDEHPKLSANIPFVSAIMQSVSGNSSCARRWMFFYFGAYDVTLNS